ncbi:hypothetical protein, partial [Nocardioides sp.]|uniref:WXG100 family type VII secretion target n=1 Tax=Nocardioides sp. TaxID=35761 RepID=UPI00286E999B
MTARVAHAADLEAQLGALGGEIAGILSQLLAPLLAKWEWLTGDDDQVHQTARRWRAMSEAVSHVAHDERAASARVVDEWEGAAKRAFDDAVGELVRDLEEIAVRTAEVADLLDEAALAVRHAEQLVRDLIRELIEWAALSLAVSAAGAIITLGASAAAGAAAAAAKAGIVGARIAARLSQLALELRRIQLALGVYQSWISSLSFAQKRLVSTVQGIVVKGVTPLDAAWKRPALDLAR